MGHCTLCGDKTHWLCSDCEIDGINLGVHVCEKAECRDKHELLIHSKAETVH